MRGRLASRTHGDYGFAQKQRCQCEPCRRAVRRYAKGLAYDKARGVKRTVDAAPVREHVLHLIEVTQAADCKVARAAGVTRAQVKRLLYGNPQKGGAEVEYLFTKTAVALLSVTVEDVLAQPGFIPAIGTHRRVQALAARGYTKDQIGEAVGISGSAVFNWMTRDMVTLDVHERMKAAYERLHMGEGTSETMRWRAKRLGWLPPLAWEDHDMDDPDAVPDRSVVKCAVESCPRSLWRGCLCRTHYEAVGSRGRRSSRHFREAVIRLGNRKANNSAVLAEQLADLKELGVSLEEAAARVGRAASTIEKMWNKVA